MAKIKSIDKISEKWSRVAPQRVQDFKDGVSNPDVDWESAASGAKNAYEQGVQEALGDDRYAKGVRAAGTDKWRRKVQDVGAERWAPGVRAAKGDFEAGFGKFVPVIERALDALPPRGPRGAPGNNERQAMMSRALHDARLKG